MPSRELAWWCPDIRSTYYNPISTNSIWKREKKKDVTVVWTDLFFKTPADSLTLAGLENS